MKHSSLICRGHRHVFDMIDVAIASGVFEDFQTEGKEENEWTHG
jgi:hypothetical protein